MEWLLWFTKFENTKPLSLLIFYDIEKHIVTLEHFFSAAKLRLGGAN